MNARGPWPHPADLAIGIVGAALLLPIELWALGPEPIGVWGVVATLFATLGLTVGLVIALAEIAAAHLTRRPWSRAIVRALGSTLATIPLSRTLFQGAFASTLPGAAWAPIWFPAAALAALTVVLRYADPLVARRGPRLGTAITLFSLVLATDGINRHVQRSEYPDIHTFLLVLECVGAGLGARLLATGTPLPWPSRSGARRRAWHVVAATIMVAFALVLRQGLQDNAAKWTVTKRGMHARMLVRLTRGVFDFDGDGHSSVLGGGDCDDANADVHPGAPEVEDNDVDENCDGITDAAETTDRLIEARRKHQRDLAQWRETEALQRLVHRTSRMNIVLVAIDALRADVLADDPASRRAFPHLFALLDESRWFTRAFAPSAGTDLSMSGLFTGRVDPWSHSTSTLPEALHDAGRVTHGVIPSEVLRYVGRTLLTRGLDAHDRLVNDKFERDVGSYTTSHRTTDLGLKFLDEVSRSAAESDPFFLWLHYFDVHEHHEVKQRDRKLRERDVDFGALDRSGRYRLMVSLVDEQVGRVVEALRTRGLWDESIIVVLSDHGEGLGEDPRLPDNHGRFVYNPLVHVPVAIRIPGVAPRRIEQPISLLDLYATILELAGVDGLASDGTSLLPFLVDDAPAELLERARPLPLNETDQFGVVLWPDKLMVRRAENLVELYDLSRDFAEQHDLSAERPERVQELMAVYAALPTVEIDRTRKGRRARERAVRTDRAR